MVDLRQPASFVRGSSGGEGTDTRTITVPCQLSTLDLDPGRGRVLESPAGGVGSGGGVESGVKCGVL